MEIIRVQVLVQNWKLLCCSHFLRYLEKHLSHIIVFFKVENKSKLSSFLICYRILKFSTDVISAERSICLNIFLIGDDNTASLFRTDIFSDVLVPGKMRERKRFLRRKHFPLLFPLLLCCQETKHILYPTNSGILLLVRVCLQENLFHGSQKKLHLNRLMNEMYIEG